MFIQLLRANSSTIFAQFSCSCVSYSLFFPLYLYLIQQTVNGAHKIKEPSQSKGPQYFKAFSFYPELFNLFERFILRFWTDCDDKQEAENVNDGKDPERVGQSERADHHRHKLPDRPVCSP